MLSGVTSIFIGSGSHRLFFRVDNKNGYVEISKRGFSGFSYKCIIENKAINDASHFRRTEHQYVQAAVETVSFYTPRCTVAQVLRFNKKTIHICCIHIGQFCIYW